MALHPDVSDAFEQIDAALFSGDSFYNKENRIKLREYLTRWNKWDAEHHYYNADGMMCNSDGTRSIFDDVDE